MITVSIQYFFHTTFAAVDLSTTATVVFTAELSEETPTRCTGLGLTVGDPSVKLKNNGTDARTSVPPT